MRILLDCRMATWTGVGRYTRGLARALARRDDLECVQVVASPKDAPAGGEAGVVVASRHPFSLAGARELGSIISRERPDAVHCMHFPTPVPVATPLVVTMHDLIPLVVPGAMPSALRRVAYRFWNRRAVAVASALISVSAHSADDIVKLFPRAAGRVRVVAAAADDFAAGAVGPLPASLADLGDAPFVLGMGTTRPHKGLDTLLHAFERLAGTHPDATLVLVGDTGEDALAAAGPVVPGRVRTSGRVDDDELRGLFSRATLFAFPSGYEGFGLPPLEAMSFGCPVVCSNAASLPEVVGDAAVLVPPRDPDALALEIGTLLDDPAAREALAARGRERAGEFSWARAAKETADVYQEAVRAHGGSDS